MSQSFSGCASCGGRGLARREGRLVCSFCGNAVDHRIVAGTLCQEDRGSWICSEPARTLCRACSRPLCDRHDDPKSLHWGGPLLWYRLFPAWTSEVAIAWSRLQEPLQRFPIDGVPAPFEWLPHLRQSSYAVGLLEDEIRASLLPVIARAGGDVSELSCRFESLCSACEQELGRDVEKHVAAKAPPYRRIAYRARLSAMEAELRQRLKYVESHLGRGLRTAARDGAVPELDSGSADADWEALGWDTVKRLQDIDRVRVASPPGDDV